MSPPIQYRRLDSESPLGKHFRAKQQPAKRTNVQNDTQPEANLKAPLGSTPFSLAS